MCVQNISKKESNESIRLSWSACCGRCGIAHTLEYYTTICDSYWFGWNWYLDRTRERRAKSRMAEKSGWNEDEYNIEKKEESPSQNDDNDEGKQKKKQYAVGHKKRTAFNVTAALFCCISDHSFAHTQTHTTHTYARIHSPKHSRRTLTKHKESQNSNRTYFGWDKTREIADIAKQLKCNTPRYLCVCAALCVRVSVCECERSRTHRPRINRRWRCTINAQTTDDRGGRRERERNSRAFTRRPPPMCRQHIKRINTGFHCDFHAATEIHIILLNAHFSTFFFSFCVCCCCVCLSQQLQIDRVRTYNWIVRDTYIDGRRNVYLWCATKAVIHRFGRLSYAQHQPTIIEQRTTNFISDQSDTTRMMRDWRKSHVYTIIRENGRRQKHNLRRLLATTVMYSYMLLYAYVHCRHVRIARLFPLVAVP